QRQCQVTIPANHRTLLRHPNHRDHDVEPAPRYHLRPTDPHLRLRTGRHHLRTDAVDRLPRPDVDALRDPITHRHRPGIQIPDHPLRAESFVPVDVALELQTRPAAPPVDADVHHHPTRRHAVPPRVHQPHFPARQHRRQQHDGSAPRSADHHPHSMYAASSSHGRYSYGSTMIISPASAMYTPPKSTYRFTTSPYGSRATSQSSIGSAHATLSSVSWTTWTRSWARSRP